MVKAPSIKEDIEGCSPVPGFSSGDIDSDTRYLIFGARSGTNEFLAEFGNITCALSRTRPVTVALDWPDTDSAAFSSYISNPHQDAADEALKALAVWDKASTDGRSSQSMFELFRLLRRLRLAGRDIEVAGCIPSFRNGSTSQTPGDQNVLEAGMADQLKVIAEKAGWWSP